MENTSSSESSSSSMKLHANRSKLTAMVEGRCPQCREGKMFKYPFWRVDKFSEMNENCPVCGLKFEIEPGFWFGAMFVSYANTIALLVVLGVSVFYIFNDPPVLYYIIPVTILSLITVPFNFRISRSVFLHLFGFVKYKPINQDFHK
jgi:uncharacterized protein (DUF983 family)